MIINWQATVAAIDADPDAMTPEGQKVLVQLLAAGRRYQTAGSPDTSILNESEDHARWRALLPSQKAGVKEPDFYGGAYSARPFSLRSSTKYNLNVRHLTMPDGAPKDAVEAFKFWQSRDTEVANQIARYFIGKARYAEFAGRPLGPTNGAIVTDLLDAVEAATEWLDA